MGREDISQRIEKPNPLIKSIYQKIVGLHKAPEEEIKSLLGKIIYFNTGGELNVIAKATKYVKDRRIAYEVIPHLFQEETNHTLKEGTIEITHINNYTTRIIFERNFQTMEYEAVKVTNKMPERIIAYHHGDEFSICEDDFSLQKLMNHLLIEVGHIKTLSDLKKLNSQIHKTIPYVEHKDLNYSENKVSLGEVITRYGGVCRHMAGLEYVMLINDDISTRIILTAQEIVEELHEAHSFLHVNIEDGIYIVDPVNNYVFPIEEVETQLIRLNKPTIYHKKVEPMKFRFHYSK